MKIALIDNGSKSIERLACILSSEVELEVILARDLQKFNSSEFSGIILSGGSTWSVLHEPEQFEDELKLIRSSTKPILGICLGAELLAYAFGGKLQGLPEKIRQELTIEIVHEDPILSPNLELQVMELHRFAITELPASLTKLAISVTGIELFRLNDTLTYGMQFHPELNEVGEKLIQNWLELVAE